MLVRSGKGGKRREVGMDDLGVAATSAMAHRQPGHANLAITSVYLQGIDNAEIIDTIHSRRPPKIPARSGRPGAAPFAFSTRGRGRRELGVPSSV